MEHVKRYIVAWFGYADRQLQGIMLTGRLDSDVRDGDHHA